MKKCLKKESNPRLPLCRVPMLTNRPWMVGWVGLMHACGAVATCVWPAYGLHPSHFDCLRREWSKLTCMDSAMGKVLVFWSSGCVFESVPWWMFCRKAGGRTVWPPGSSHWVVRSLGGQSVGWWVHWVVNLLGGEFIGWAIPKVGHPTGSNRLVDNPQVDKSTIHRIFLYCKLKMLQKKARGGFFCRILEDAHLRRCAWWRWTSILKMGI